MTPTPPAELESDELPSDPLAFRRVWTKVYGAQPSSSLALKTFGVLYDAGRPLSRQELLEGLLLRLDPYDKAYLQAWDARNRGQVQAGMARRRKSVPRAESTLVISTNGFRDITAAADRWILMVFDRRRYGPTLIRDEQGRYRPGPVAPRMQTAEGLVPFTPETRTAQEIADRTASQAHAMGMEWHRVRGELDPLLPTREARLAVLLFLVRRFAGIVKTDEHRLRRVCHHLLKADLPAVQQAVLEQVLQWACQDPAP